MTGKSAKVGSIWRRWDLHIHAPGTKLSNAYGDPSDDNLKTYLETLEASDVQIFGITDYFSFDGYLAVVERYKELYPEGNKFFIPNIEFRLTETISSDGVNVHTHVLIDPKVATKEKLSTFLTDVTTHKTRNGVPVRCSELQTTSDYQEATVSITEIKRALPKVFDDETTYLIVTAGSNDGLRGVTTRSRRSISITNELDKASHAFFGSSKNTEYFLKTDRYEDGTESPCLSA